MKFCACLLGLSVFFSAAASGGDWPHYRGPSLNGSSSERISAFPATGPEELWRVQLGTGLSSVTVSGGRAYSAGYDEGSEKLFCLDAATGRTIWTHSWPAKRGNFLFDGGPRATPTLDSGRVYMVGADGHVACVNATSGKPIWEKNLVRDFGGKRMDWGFCCSPTVDGKNIILDSGGKGASTVALNKETGALAWKSGDDETGYGSAILAELGGKRTAILVKAEALVGYDASRGGELWRFEWETSYKANAASPVVVGEKVLVSSGYNHGAAAVRVAGGKAEQVWFTKSLKAHFNSPVFLGGFAYGVDGDVGRRSALVCIDMATGEEKWRAREVKNGSVLRADDKLVALSEDGELVLAEASPKGYAELGRKKILSGRCWVQPALAHGRLYCRNNAGELVAFAVGGK
ncbi:MAG: PQQ-binding-like beta-propeller repeat protein [Chthoniobacteraceae bacterium]